MGLARPKTERKIFIPQCGTGKGPRVLSPKPPSHLHCPWLTSHPSSPPSTRGQCSEEHGHIYSSHLSSAVIWDKRSFSTPFTVLLWGWLTGLQVPWAHREQEGKSEGASGHMLLAFSSCCSPPRVHLFERCL